MTAKGTYPQFRPALRNDALRCTTEFAGRPFDGNSRPIASELSLRAFSKLYFERQSGPKIKISKGMVDEPQ